MKLPNLPKRKTKAKPEKGTSRSPVRTPRAVEDLYRDMRDRRLLVPTLALLAAIVAVPVMLSASPEEPPPAVAYVPPEGAEAVSPAVLTEQPIGVRDYRERLDELKQKNPFADHFSFPKVDGQSATDTGAGDTGSTTDPGSSVDTSAPTTSNTDLPPTDPGTTDPDGSPDTTQPSDGNDVVLILAPRIDVLAGAVHKRKRIEDVEIGDLLPDRRKAPIAMLMGVSDDLEFAHFVVSDDVTDTTGEGQCRPSARNCEFLRLRDNEKRYFTYGPDDERFSIKVTDIREKVVDRRKVKSS